MKLLFLSLLLIQFLMYSAFAAPHNDINLQNRDVSIGNWDLVKNVFNTAVGNAKYNYISGTGTYTVTLKKCEEGFNSCYKDCFPADMFYCNKGFLMGIEAYDRVSTESTKFNPFKAPPKEE